MTQNVADRLRSVLGCEYAVMATYRIIDINTLIGYLLTVKEMYGDMPVFIDTGTSVSKPSVAHLMRAGTKDGKMAFVIV